MNEPVPEPVPRQPDRASSSAPSPAPEPAALATEAPARCKNCDAPLYGPYCSRCGQPVRGSARSIVTLLFDARDALIHLDSRLWRTLHALALRPGRLTAEYFAERRASYLPPFRLYLVLSLVFFTLAALERLKLGGDAVVTTATEEAWQEAQRGVAGALEEARSAGASPEKLAALERAVKELERRGPKAAPGAPGQEAPAAAEPGAKEPPSKAPGVTWRAGEEPDAPPEKLCDIQVSGSPRLQAALVDACRKNVADGGRTLWRTVAANIPRMMFVFLPLMALFLKAIYWRPRRYYVEHLVFFLHAHAAVFLVSIAALGLRALARAAGADGLAGLIGFLAWCYGTWYVFRAMRVYYGQGRLLTSLKFFSLGVAYLAFLSMTLLGTVIISAWMASGG